MQSVTKSIAKYLDIPFKDGVIIVEVNASSPAYRAGLEPGDVIISANGKKVYMPSDIRKVILENDLRSGDILSLRVYRDRKKRKVEMRLGKYRHR